MLTVPFEETIENVTLDIKEKNVIKKALAKGLKADPIILLMMKVLIYFYASGTHKLKKELKFPLRASGYLDKKFTTE